MFPATLTTERLLLRPPRLEDAQANFDRYGSDSEVTRYLSWPTNTHVGEAEAFLRSITGTGPNNGDQHWAICFEGDPLPAGMITTFGYGALVGVGYVLRRSLWGRGVMSESLKVVARAIWQDPKVWRLQAYAHVDNRGSQRVLEKAGLRFEGVARRRFFMPQIGDQPQDCRIYAQVRDDLGE